MKFLYCVLLLGIILIFSSQLYSQIDLDLSKSGNDVALYWSPEDNQDVLYFSLGNPFDTLVSNASPWQYHVGVLDDDVDYCYKVVDPSTVSNAGDIYQIDYIVGAMRYVPNNEPWGFLQGSPDTEPCRDDTYEPQFTHILTRDIAVMELEVTRQMWSDLGAVQGGLPPDPSYTDWGQGMDHPVQQVTWYEAILFANLLSIENGYTRCYYEDASFTIPVTTTTPSDVYCNFDATGYRLLTEGEWEYSCRAGTFTPFSEDVLDYDDITCESPDCQISEFAALQAVATYCTNSGNQTAVAGSLAGNPWYLRDMHGNVWDWIWDWSSPTPYPTGTVVDFTGAATGMYKRMRGGSWFHVASNLRSAMRTNSDLTARNNRLGFRLCRTVN